MGRGNPRKVTAPWPPEVVEALWCWQENTNNHPYTCAKRGDERHSPHAILVPTADGWTCPYCEYTQDWAHDPREFK